MTDIKQNENSRKSNKVVIAAVLAALMVTGGAFVGVSQLKAGTSLQTTPVSTVQNLPIPSASVNIADIVEQVSPAVVSILVTQKSQPAAFQGGNHPFGEFFERFFDEDTMRQFRQQLPRGGQERGNRGPRAQGIGSGFIIEKDGLIVTNHHVIDGAEKIEVQLQDDRKVQAKLVGTDPKTDLALLKIDVDEDLATVKFGDSANMRVGEWVLAMGNPFGIGKTATTGIVSARHRNIGAGPFDDFIQIDAPINRGNSGGPAFNLKGEVIGVNTAIFSPSGGNVGIGFAIPSNMAKDIIDDLKKDGTVERGWLGVHIQQVTPELAESLDLGKARGALVSKVVDDSPADDADLKRGDVILNVDGADIQKLNDLPRLIAAIDAGDTARLSVWRDGERKAVKVKIGETPSVEKVAKASQTDTGVQGMQLSELDDQARRSLGLSEKVDGVVVSRVASGSPAAETGLRRGDVIVSAGNKNVDAVDDLRKVIGDAKDGGKRTVLLLIVRGNQERFVALPLRDA